MQVRLVRRLRIWSEWVDTLLDALPTFEDGHWCLYGGWGCTHGLHRLWDKT